MEMIVEISNLPRQDTQSQRSLIPGNSRGSLPVTPLKIRTAIPFLALPIALGIPVAEFSSMTTVSVLRTSQVETRAKGAMIP